MKRVFKLGIVGSILSLLFVACGGGTKYMNINPQIKKTEEMTKVQAAGILNQAQKTVGGNNHCVFSENSVTFDFWDGKTVSYDKVSFLGTKGYNPSQNSMLISYYDKYRFICGVSKRWTNNKDSQKIINALDKLGVLIEYNQR